MNLKVVYIAGASIVIVAVILFLVTDFGIFSNGNSNVQKSNINNNIPKDIEPVKLSVKNIIPKPINNNSSNMQILFEAYNPTRSTVLLEAIHYNIFLNDTRLVSGDIGTKPEGFVASQEGVFPIVSNSTTTLKDMQVLKLNNKITDRWKDILGNKSRYIINGTYSYAQTSSLESNAADKDFNFTFP
jgi:hypothetical protein